MWCGSYSDGDVCAELCESQEQEGFHPPRQVKKVLSGGAVYVDI